METHRVKECRIRASLPCNSVDGEGTGNDQSTSTGRKTRSVGMWNADGELLQNTDLLVRYVLCICLRDGDGFVWDERKKMGWAMFSLI